MGKKQQTKGKVPAPDATRQTGHNAQPSGEPHVARPSLVGTAGGLRGPSEDPPQPPKAVVGALTPENLDLVAKEKAALEGHSSVPPGFAAPGLSQVVHVEGDGTQKGAKTLGGSGKDKLRSQKNRGKSGSSTASVPNEVSGGTLEVTPGTPRGQSEVTD